MGHSLPILRQGVGLRISARRQAPLGRGSRDRRTSARSLPFCADGAPNCGQVICNVRHNKRNVSGVIAGARVISTASAADHAYVRSLGADEVIDYNASATQRRCPTAMRSSIRSAAMSAEVFRRAQAGAAAPPSLPRARRRRSPHAATATGVQRLVYLLVTNKPFWHGKEISARRYRRYARCWRLPRAT
jgi:hypothetical protein